jgi:outer membrane protein OmpA-like peptidoglycan-associated protein
MNKKWLFSLIVFFLSPFVLLAQSGTANKDAGVNVFVTDFKNKPLDHEIIVFKSKVNAKEYQGLTDSTGKFTLRLPVGDIYEVLIWGFNDSTSYSFLDIPTPKGNAYYKDAFKVDIQYLPAKSFVLEDCNFETGKAILQPESYKVIDELVAFLLRKDDEKIELGGHTDNVGKPAKNMVLSLQRAQTVMAYVISKGVDPSRVKAKGYGMTKPIASNKTAAGKALNRRTEVKILE